jgi:hypothetical protein
MRDDQCIRSTSFTNEGTINVSDGTVDISSTSFTNSGTLIVNGGTLDVTTAVDGTGSGTISGCVGHIAFE